MSHFFDTNVANMAFSTVWVKFFGLLFCICQKSSNFAPA